MAKPMTMAVSTSDCGTGSATVEREEDAEEWAATHNAENHDEPDTADSDYDHYKESLRDK